MSIFVSVISLYILATTKSLISFEKIGQELSDEPNKNSKRKDNEIETENPDMVLPHLDTLDQGTEALCNG